MSVLQKMHAETARLHRQFLDGQTAAMRTLEALVQTGSRPMTMPAVWAFQIARVFGVGLDDVFQYPEEES